MTPTELKQMTLSVYNTENYKLSNEDKRVIAININNDKFILTTITDLINKFNNGN
jgi:hypothetical protein